MSANAGLDLVDDGGSGDLRGRTIRGGAILSLGVLLQQAVRFLIMAILARLLTPHDYGLLGMVMSVMALVTIFGDLSLAMATVQKANLTQAQLSTMFWINLGLGTAATVVTAFLSPFLAWFFKEYDLFYVSLLMSLTFALTGLGSQQNALLAKRMNFKAVTAANVVAITAGGTVGIVMALKDYGVYALVGQNLVFESVRTALFWVFSRWVPGLPRRGTGVRGMLKIGGFMTGFNFVNYFANNLDKVLVGRFFGAVETGLYTRAFTLVGNPNLLVTIPSSRVMVPALSRLQDDHPRMGEAYLRGLLIISLLYFPVLAGTLVTSREIIEVVFGSQWVRGAPIVTFLCVAYLWQGLYISGEQIFGSTGRTDRLFYYILLSSPLIIACYLTGLKWQSVGVAAGFAVSKTVLLLPYLAYSVGTIGLPMRRVIKTFAPPLVISLLMAAAVWGVKQTLPPGWSVFLRLGLLVATGSVLYGLMVLALYRSQVTDAYQELLGHFFPTLAAKYAAGEQTRNGVDTGGQTSGSFPAGAGTPTGDKERSDPRGPG